jgi:hypothetical protein
VRRIALGFAALALFLGRSAFAEPTVFLSRTIPEAAELAPTRDAGGFAGCQFGLIGEQLRAVPLAQHRVPEREHPPRRLVPRITQRDLGLGDALGTELAIELGLSRQPHATLERQAPLVEAIVGAHLVHAAALVIGARGPFVRTHDEPTSFGKRRFEQRSGGMHVGRIGDRGAYTLGGRQLGRIRIVRGSHSRRQSRFCRRSGLRRLHRRLRRHLCERRAGCGGSEQRNGQRRAKQRPLHRGAPVVIRATSVPDSIMGQIQ